MRARADSQYLLDAILASPDQPIPDLLNQTFQVVDTRISRLSQSAKSSSGSTAAVALLRCEHVTEHEPKGFTNPGLSPRGLMESKGEEELEAQLDAGAGGDRRNSQGAGSMQRKHSGRRLRNFVRGLTGTEKRNSDELEAEESTEGRVEAIEAKADKEKGGMRRVLYTANVGDARAVLCRGGRSVRLTYDHKGSDTQEAKRITDAGGFVLNNRVNGELALTSIWGDRS